MNRAFSISRRMMGVAMLCLIVPVVTNAFGAPMSTHKESRMNANEIIEHWLQQIESVPEGDFIPIPDFEAFDSRARTESMQWCRTFLSPAADPHKITAQVRHGYYPAGQARLDLLRHDYALGDQPVSIFEGVNFLIVRLPARNAQAWTGASAEAAVRQVLHVADPQHPWTFEYPHSLVEGAVISTAPAQDPVMMASWSQRADILLRRGQLYIVLYKRQPSTMGFQHDAQWLEDALRRR